MTTLNSTKFPPEQEVASLEPLLVRGAAEPEVRGSEGGARV